MSPQVPQDEGVRRTRWWYVLALSLLVAGPVQAQSPTILTGAEGPAEQEPITPVPPPPPTDPRIAALGEHLFDDPHLSGDETRACSSCHDVRTNGSDGRRLDVTPTGGLATFRTLTVFNAALSFRMNWEGNAETLEDAAALSLSDPQLMASSLAKAVTAVDADKVLSRQFEKVNGHGANPGDLLNAIATYERSLVTPGSRFDLWLGGNKAALSAEEQNGYELFKSFGCVSCHQGVDLGGNLFERSGIFHSIGGAQGQLLLVPSLRNIAVMAPYFHNGSAGTLDKAVAEMGYAQLDRHLSDDQVTAISAFLATLTGRYNGRQLTHSP
jgi:cytochrome c peroxidase